MVKHPRTMKDVPIIAVWIRTAMNQQNRGNTTIK